MGPRTFVGLDRHLELKWHADPLPLSARISKLVQRRARLTTAPNNAVNAVFSSLSGYQLVCSISTGTGG